MAERYPVPGRARTGSTDHGSSCAICGEAESSLYGDEHGVVCLRCVAVIYGSVSHDFEFASRVGIAGLAQATTPSDKELNVIIEAAKVRDYGDESPLILGLAKMELRARRLAELEGPS